MLREGSVDGAFAEKFEILGKFVQYPRNTAILRICAC